MEILLIVAGIVAALWAIDRLALAAEARGWIYWRRRQASLGTRAGAMLEIQALLEPGRRHVIEARQSEEAMDGDEVGDGI